jgi:signal transduction histidine kinase
MIEPSSPEPIPLIAALGRGAEFRRWLEGLDTSGLRLMRCDDAEALTRVLRDQIVLGLLIDGDLGIDGLELLRLLRGEALNLPLILVGDKLDDKRLIEAMKRGAWAIPRSIPASELSQSIRVLASRRAKERAQQRLVDELNSRVRLNEGWTQSMRRRIEELFKDLEMQRGVITDLCAKLLEGTVDVQQQVSIERIRSAAGMIGDHVAKSRQRMPMGSSSEARLQGARRAGRQPLRLEEIAEQARSVFADAARTQGLALTVEAPNDLPDVWADRTGLGQIIINLVSNALRHTPSGGSVKIILSREPKVPSCRITIADSGTGIPLEDHARVFERGWSTEGRPGLGLAICKQLAQEHRAALTFESEPGKGTSFHLVLPIDARSTRTTLQILPEPSLLERLLGSLKEGGADVRDVTEIEVLADRLISSGGTVVVTAGLDPAIDEVIEELRQKPAGSSQ